MKKVLMVLSISLFLFSCDSSSCKCFNYLNGLEYKSGKLDPKLHFYCNDKYRDKIPESYKGTPKFGEEVKKLSKKDLRDL